MMMKQYMSMTIHDMPTTGSGKSWSWPLQSSFIKTINLAFFVLDDRADSKMGA